MVGFKASVPKSNVQRLRLRMANAYLIQASDGSVLVDAGMPGDANRILKQMRVAGCRELSLIFITHAHLDHYGSVVELKKLTGAPIAIHRADASALAEGRTDLGEVRGRGRLIKIIFPLIQAWFAREAVQADILLDDTDELTKFGINARVLHTPGHTPGSSSLWIEQGEVFVGDLISSNNGAHVQRFYATDWDLIPLSLARLQALSPEIIYPGHGPEPIDGNTFGRLTSEN